MRPFSLKRPTVLAVLLVIAVGLVAGACSDGDGSTVSSIAEQGQDGGGGEGGDDSAAQPESPPETEAPPATEAPTPEEPETESESEALTVFIILVVLLLLAVLIGGLIGGRSRKEEPARAAPAPDTDLNNVVATANWLHDSASLEVLSSPADQVTQQWQRVRPRAVDLQTQASAQAMGSATAQLSTASTALASAVGSLTSSLDSYVTLRQRQQAGEAVSDELVTEAQNSVMARRRDVQAAVGQVQAAR